MKAVCALLIVVACFATLFAWFADKPDALTWVFRLGSPIVGALAIGLILRLHYRTDLAPDYLRKQAGDYFNRGGFCFAFSAASVEGICYLVA